MYRDWAIHIQYNTHQTYSPVEFARYFDDEFRAACCFDCWRCIGFRCRVDVADLAAVRRQRALEHSIDFDRTDEFDVGEFASIVVLF